MKQYLFWGQLLTDADHLFDPANLGYQHTSPSWLLARRPEYADARFVNRGHEGFTIERRTQMLRRDGIGGHWDAITLLAGVNDIPVELFTGIRIPLEFSMTDRKCWIFYASILPPSCYWNRFFLMNRQNTPPGILISKKKARSSTIWHSLILLILSRRTRYSDRQPAVKASMRSQPTGFI